MTILFDLFVILAVAVVVVTLLQRVRVPSIAGFIASGVIVGPHALAVVQDVHRVDVLAEIGVIFLLFGIGLELSLDHLRRLWKPILVGGFLQVGLTILAATGLSSLFGLPWRSALLVGFLVSASSTAIVLKALNDRSEIDAPHGRLTLGILVFQDLSVVPMMLLLPAMASSTTEVENVGLGLLKAFALLIGVFVAARLVAPRALHFAAQTRRRDLFVLVVFLICIGTAWAVSQAGVSLAIGAFLAGLVVAGSQYRSQALSDLIPFREVLSSVFFVSVGMLLDLRAVWSNIGIVGALLLAIIVGKFLVTMAAGAIMQLPLRVTILTSAALAQVGEFSFVLARGTQTTSIIDPALMTNLLAAFVLSMILAPLALTLGPRLAAGAETIRVLAPFLGVRSAHDAGGNAVDWREHVIIAGFGVTGQELAQSLRITGIPYLIVDINPENVRNAIAAGEPAYFGDVTSADVLAHLGIQHAKELVLVINDPSACERTIVAARSLHSTLEIIVRSRYLGDMAPLRAAGASRVIPAEIEAGAEVAAVVLRRHGVAERVVADHVVRIRGREVDA